MLLDFLNNRNIGLMSLKLFHYSNICTDTLFKEKVTW
jgi:hypothetical protein